jgi:hypothetical protein
LCIQRACAFAPVSGARVDKTAAWADGTVARANGRAEVEMGEGGGGRPWTDTLAPIRLDIAQENHVLRDAFTWDCGPESVGPGGGLAMEMFARQARTPPSDGSMALLCQDWARV